MMNLVIKLVVAYFVGLNLFSFLLFGIDKSKAKRGSKRISEKTLFLTSFLGGAFGSLLGMKLSRHKTRKTGFKIIMLFLTLWNILIYFLIIDRFFYDVTALI